MDRTLPESWHSKLQVVNLGLYGTATDAPSLLCTYTIVERETVQKRVVVTKSKKIPVSQSSKKNWTTRQHREMEAHDDEQRR